jgi:hypothetical protein
MSSCHNAFSSGGRANGIHAKLYSSPYIRGASTVSCDIFGNDTVKATPFIVFYGQQSTCFAQTDVNSIRMPLSTIDGSLMNITVI